MSIQLTHACMYVRVQLKNDTMITEDDVSDAAGGRLLKLSVWRDHVLLLCADVRRACGAADIDLPSSTTTELANSVTPR